MQISIGSRQMGAVAQVISNCCNFDIRNNNKRMTVRVKLPRIQFNAGIYYYTVKIINAASTELIYNYSWAGEFQVVGYRTRWFVTSLVVLFFAATRMLPRFTPLLRTLGFVETFRATRIRIDGADRDGVCQIDAESLAVTLPQEIGTEDDPLPMYVPS